MATNYGQGRFSICSYTTAHVRVTSIDSVPALAPPFAPPSRLDHHPDSFSRRHYRLVRLQYS
jgi:hypothetical protein